MNLGAVLFYSRTVTPASLRSNRGNRTDRKSLQCSCNTIAMNLKDFPNDMPTELDYHRHVNCFHRVENGCLKSQKEKHVQEFLSHSGWNCVDVLYVPCGQ
jgi:hypothetical protein